MPKIILDSYDLKRPYSMISGQAVVAEHTYERSKCGRFFWAVNVDEPGAFIYYDSGDPKSDGFGGATLTFKLTDGSEVKVKGPWHSNSDHLFSETGVDLRDKHKTWGIVAKGRECIPIPPGVSGNSAFYRFTNVFHLDEAPVVGSFTRIQDLAQKIADELGEQVFYYSESHGGSSCVPVLPSNSKKQQSGWQR